MDLRKRYQVDWYPPGKFPLSERHFALEVQAFGNIQACPINYREFKTKYASKNFVMCTCLLDGTPIGFKLSEKITKIHFHDYIVVIDREHRGQGIGERLGSILLQELIGKDVEYATNFSVPEMWNFERNREQRERISEDSELTSTETELLKNIERHRQLAIQMPRTRIQKDYYTYRDGSYGDAMFKCYRISGYFEEEDRSCEVISDGC